MKFADIEYMSPINAVDADRVAEIAESIKANGWRGCPILVCNDQLLTGSHRLAALKMLADEEWEDIDAIEVAEDVTDIVIEHMDAFEAKNGWCPDIDYARIGGLLDGSWVEQYADEIAEWW